MTNPQKLDQLKLAFFFYFRRIFWTQTQQGSQSHQAWVQNYDLCEKAPKKQTRTPSVPHLPREVHHFVHCRQEEPGRENFKPTKWQSIVDFQKVSKEKGRRERFLNTSPKVKVKVTTPVSRSMLIRAPTPRDPDGSKMLFLGK